jgi:hypothetical protein
MEEREHGAAFHRSKRLGEEEDRCEGEGEI